MLDSSIFTSVLIGLLIVWLLQETLGWNFTGLVVPGYLASVLILQPATGLVMAAEAIITYLVVLVLSNASPLWIPWTPVFGRDRFFAILLASVGVRVALEFAGFEWMASALGLEVNAGLYSMGLVIVPLAANALWRTGLTAGIPQIGIPVMATWAVLQFVLLPLTNLNLSNFELTFENLALDFLVSPKAYILLLTGAWMASVANLRWGWNFGGILVPGLLALCWLEPTRLLATAVEALVIALCVRGAIALPWLRYTNMSGGRLIVLAFGIGYLIKFALGWILGEAWPGLQIRQLFGFGYLLPALIALRIVRSGDPLQVLIPAGVTSLAGFVGGALLGYGLAVLVPERYTPSPDEQLTAERGGYADLLTAAHQNAGEFPAGLGATLAGDERLLLTAGSGFGGLLVRPEGAPLAVTARVGSPGHPGLSAAAYEIAEALDAKAVLICARTGPACGRARTAVALHLPLLVVEGGDDTLYRPDGRLRVDLGALSQAVPGLTLSARAEEHATLTLSPAVSLKIADALQGEPPADTLDPEALQALAEIPTNQVAREQFGLGWLRALRHDVVRPWMAWRETGDPLALRVAAGNASAMGLALGADGERSALAGTSWYVLVDRRQGEPDSGALVHVPFSADAPQALDLARAVWLFERGAALVVDTPPTLSRETYLRGRPAQTVILGLAESLGEDLRILGVRGIRDVYDPGAEIVLSTGRPIGRGEDPHPLADATRDLMLSASFSTRFYDGSAQRLSFQDPENPARYTAQAATGGSEHVTIWATTPARQRVAALDADHRLGPAVAATGLSSLTRDLDALTAAIQLGDPGAEWDVVRRALDSFDRSAEARDLQAALRAADAAGAAPALLCEPLAGCRWLALSRCDAPAEGAEEAADQPPTCEGLIAPLRRANLRPPTADASPAARLLLGGGDMIFTGLPAPASQPEEASP